MHWNFLPGVMHIKPSAERDLGQRCWPFRVEKRHRKTLDFLTRFLRGVGSGLGFPD
jgi:hypothetical protein